MLAQKSWQVGLEGDFLLHISNETMESKIVIKLAAYPTRFGTESLYKTKVSSCKRPENINQSIS